VEELLFVKNRKNFQHINVNINYILNCFHSNN